jgi:diguanylate cyclase (GGDEF)-like protein
MTLERIRANSSSPESFVVEVFSEVCQKTIQERWQAVNVIVRLSMLAGLHMQLDAALNMLSDFAAEIVPHERSIVCFRDDNSEQPQVRVVRGIESPTPDLMGLGNLLNIWAAKYSRPLLVGKEPLSPANAYLESVEARSALVVPLFVSNKAVGSLQLFSSREGAFTAEDAQLLWVLSLVAESLLTRDYANDGLVRLAFTDYLTGLKTRGYFEQQLELEIKRSERKKTKFSLLMIDIDFFKNLNDRHGHHAGDQVLRDVASIMMKDMREVDTVARYGGEEFVIILPETGSAGAKFVAERVRRAVEHAKFFAGSPSAVEALTISIGITVFDEDAHFRRDLIENADAALYYAKAHGRNNVALYSEIARSRGKEAG